MTTYHSIALRIAIADERQLAGSGPVDDTMLVHAICCRILQSAADAPADKLPGYYRHLGMRVSSHPAEQAGIARAMAIIGHVMDDAEEDGQPITGADRLGELT